MDHIQKQQNALFLVSQHGNFVAGTTPVPQPSKGQLLIKIMAAALNPVDWRIQKYGGFVDSYPAIVGWDIAGEVAAPLVTSLTQVKIANEYSGFQQYALADELHTAKIPSNVTVDQAASTPLALPTVYLAMYNTRPNGIALVNPVVPSGEGHYKGEPFVVIGGATSVGQFAIQMAKISGFSPIIATASIKHRDFLKSTGATHVLDRGLSAANLRTEVEKITKKPVKCLFDSVSLLETQEQGDAVLASGGYLVLVHPPLVSASGKHVVAISILREMGHNIKLLSSLYDKLTGWLKNGVIKPNKVEVLPDGLNGIIGGLKALENNQVSGVKLVARPDETT